MKHLLLAIFAALCFISPASAAMDMFMKFEQPSGGAAAITGDSMDATYSGAQGWFEVLSFGFGVANPITIGGPGGLTAGAATFNNFVITRYVGQGSAAFLQACVTGGRYGQVTLVIRRTGENQVRVMQAKLYTVLVQSVTSSASGGEDRLTENLTFRHASHEIQFYTQSNTGAEVVAGAPTTWNQVTNSGSK
jgi:type VI secretion system secreted protein Hcp